MPRQRTLKGTLDWSYDLLSETEQTLFERLSVFTGGWTLEAAEAVGAGEGVEEGEVLDLLSGLVEKSLVMVRGGDPGGARYRLLEPVRQYALDKLEESGEAEEARRRHAEFILGLAEKAEPQLRASVDVEWFERLEAEHDNLRAALSWALQREGGELGLRLAGALGHFWQARGYGGEGQRWIEEVLEKGSGAPAPVRTKALQFAGWMALDQGDFDRAWSAAEEGLRLCDEAGIGGVVAASFKNTLGRVAASRGDYDLATELNEEGLGLCREAEDMRQVAWSLLLLGKTSGGRGDIDRAKQFYEEGLALSREVGGSRPLASFLVNLGYEYLLEGNHEQARVLNEEAVEVYREHRQRGDLQYALDNLGWVALVGGDCERAKILYKESLRLCRELGDKMIAVESMEGLACAAGAEGAAMLFGAAQALHEKVGKRQTTRESALREPYLATARSRLDEAAWEAAFAEGRAMELEEAIEYALSEDDSSMLSTRTPKQTSATLRPFTLTRREREVAKLVARGLTNRRIAEELVLSERTVENHVRNILKKLNLSSRSEIAAWVEAQRS